MSSQNFHGWRKFLSFCEKSLRKCSFECADAGGKKRKTLIGDETFDMKCVFNCIYDMVDGAKFQKWGLKEKK